MRLPNRQTLLVLEPGVEVTAKEAPPSMTYKGPFPTVGMEPMVAFVTYLDENPVELTVETKRTVTNDVEISANTERTVTSDDPVFVEIEASTQRVVTNNVEITIPTVRNVTSFKVDLEIGTRRDVIVSGDMEIGTQRNVEARIEIEASTVRNVLNNEDSEIGIPTKEYGSFVEKNKLFRVQHDVLNEDVSDNPYFEKQISNLRNAALLTRNQTVIKAINELFVSQREAFLSTFTALEKVNTTLGDLVTDKHLRAQYAKMGAESVIDGLVKLSANVDTIISFIGMQAESLDYYRELGYEDLLATLKGLNEKIKSIDFDWNDMTEDELAWMFRATDYIPEIKDQVFSLLEQMQDEIDAFKNGTTSQFLNLKSETELTLARQYQTLIERMNSPYERVTEQEIRNMFKSLGQEEDLPDEEEDVYFQMFQSLVTKLQDDKEELEGQIEALRQSQAVLLQDLEGWADVTVRDIQTLFTDISEDQDAQDVYIELFRTFSARLDAQAELFEQEIARLETRIETGITESEAYADVTEAEVRRIFDIPLDGDPGGSSGGGSLEVSEVIAIINGLTDRIIAQEEESDRLKQRIATLEEQADSFSRSLDTLSNSIATKFAEFNNFTAEVGENIRSILSSLENAEQAIEGAVTYDVLVTYLNTELETTISSVKEIDNRVTGLEEKVEAAFTEEDIVSTEEISSLFDSTAWVDNYEVISEDDIYSMFERPYDDEGNPLPTTSEKVQEMLELIADEDDIYDMFPDTIRQTIPQSDATESVQEVLDDLATEDDILDLFSQYIDGVEVHSMEELLEALANRNNAQGS